MIEEESDQHPSHGSLGSVLSEGMQQHPPLGAAAKSVGLMSTT